jgi:hypothetical protein
MVVVQSVHRCHSSVGIFVVGLDAGPYCVFPLDPLSCVVVAQAVDLLDVWMVASALAVVVVVVLVARVFWE